jgi:hypothetical protein
LAKNRVLFKVVDKEGVAVKEISTTKKKPSTLHQENRKGLRASGVSETPPIPRTEE